MHFSASQPAVRPTSGRSMGPVFSHNVEYQYAITDLLLRLRFIHYVIVGPFIFRCFSFSLTVHSCSLMYMHVHSCTLMFTLAHSCTPMFTHVHPCSLMYTHVHSCTCMFTHVHPCSLMYTLCSLKYTHVNSYPCVITRGERLWYFEVITIL